MADPSVMRRWFYWAARGFGYLWIGLLTAVAQWQAQDRTTIVIQIAGYALIGLAGTAWVVLETRPEARLLERWMPALLGLIATVSGFISMSHNGALLVLFACIAAVASGGEASLRASATIACLGIIGVLVGGATFGANAAEMIGFPVTILSALLIGRQRGVYRIQAEQAEQLLTRTRELQVQQRRADVLDERARIAREIHDVLAHSLGGLAIQIQAARAVLTDSGDIDRALDVLSTAQRMASDGLTETRRAVHALRSDALALDQEVRTLGATHENRFDTPVRVTVDGHARDLTPSATIALLRVVQEALVNAAKHAPGRPVEVCLAYEPAEVTLAIRNEIEQSVTVGHPELRTIDGGYGLTGMKERLLLIGGTLEAGPQDDRWTVTAVAPCPSAGTED